MPQLQKQNLQKRGLYRRSEDDDIYLYLGKFTLLTADELAVLSSRNVVSLRKRLRQLCRVGLLGRVEGGKQREEFFEEIQCRKCGTMNKLALLDGKIRPKPNFHYLTERGGEKAASLLENPIAWRSKAESRVDHDRVITTIHLALDQAFGTQLTDWRQQKQDVRTTVQLGEKLITFYPDAQATLNGEMLWFEYANSEPSSKDGVNDIVTKVMHYNQLMRHEHGKVIFIFRESAMVSNFVNRIADDFPYLWPHVTDLESITTRPTERIFYTPKDFDVRSHGLIE